MSSTFFMMKNILIFFNIFNLKEQQRRLNGSVEQNEAPSSITVRVCTILSKTNSNKFNNIINCSSNVCHFAYINSPILTPRCLVSAQTTSNAVKAFIVISLFYLSFCLTFYPLCLSLSDSNMTIDW